jgi:hypothetical protein
VDATTGGHAGDIRNPRASVLGAAYSDQEMRDAFDILIPVALAAVAITLAIGVYSLFRGGDFGRLWSNKLMRLRVLLQFCAIVIVAAAVWWRTRGH